MPGGRTVPRTCTRHRTRIRHLGWPDPSRTPGSPRGHAPAAGPALPGRTAGYLNLPQGLSGRQAAERLGVSPAPSSVTTRHYGHPNPNPRSRTTLNSGPDEQQRRLLELSDERDLWMERLNRAERDGYQRGYRNGAAAGCRAGPRGDRRRPARSRPRRAPERTLLRRTRPAPLPAGRADGLDPEPEPDPSTAGTPILNWKCDHPPEAHR